MTYGSRGAAHIVKNWSARDYVQDGLALWRDGIENIGWGQSNRAATQWFDLVTGTGVAINENVWTENSLSVQRQGNTFGTNIVSYGTDFTMHVCARNPDYLTAGFYSILAGYAASTEKGVCIQFGHTPSNPPTVEVRTGYSGALLASVSLGFAAPSLRTVYDVVWQRNSRTYDVYVNGIMKGSATIALADYDLDSQNNDFLFAHGWNNIVGHGIELYDNGLYGRALSAAEIAHNYNIDRLRFNLP